MEEVEDSVAVAVVAVDVVVVVVEVVVGVGQGGVVVVAVEWIVDVSDDENAVVVPLLVVVVHLLDWLVVLVEAHSVVLEGVVFVPFVAVDEVVDGSVVVTVGLVAFVTVVLSLHVAEDCVVVLGLVFSYAVLVS